MSDTVSTLEAQTALRAKPAVRLDQQTVATTRPAQPEWGSDLIVDMLRLLGVEYIALNPGASFRGLHDSLVNYNGNQQPGIILCNHEEVAVAVAHGYAKATGRAMAAGLHTNIGLLHGSMPIFNAFVDRCPVFILGGTGPMDSTHRRPGVDWNHTSNGLGSVARDYTKWEQQPASLEAIPEAMLRAWHLAMTEPCGPVFLSLDSSLQEEKIDRPLALPDLSRFPLPLPIEPPPEAVRAAARWLTQAEHPVILLGETTQSRQAWDQMIELAELLAAAVIQDFKAVTSFPTNHFLQQASFGKSGRSEANEVLKQADVVLALERVGTAGALRAAATAHTDHYQLPGAVQHTTPKLINVSLDHYAVRSWATDFQELAPADLAISANVERTVAAVLEEVRRELADDPTARRRAEQRADTLRARRAGLETAWQAYNKQRWDLEPGTIERAVGELRAALGDDYEEAIVARIPNAWPSGLWDFTRPKAHLGKDGAGGLGDAPAMAIGAALGVRATGRPVIAFMGDGDTLFAPNALWTAAHYRVPVLFLVSNNCSYYNDEEHQAHIAHARGRPVENRWIGMRIDDPLVDFAGLARSLGIEAFGPTLAPGDIAAACAAAVQLLRHGEPVLIDIRVTEI